MLIRDWMSQNPVVAKPGTSIMKASKLMKEHRIRRLPVVDDDGVLVGIVSDRDIKEASPSKATSLDMHELYYLLSEIKVADIMRREVIRVTAGDTVEKAAVLMLRQHVGGLPVVDEAAKVVGIITDSDIFKVLASITGVLAGGLQLAFELPDVSGSLRAVLDDLKAHNARIISILTSYEAAPAGTRHVYVRVHCRDEASDTALIEHFTGNPTLLYWAKDAC